MARGRKCPQCGYDMYGPGRGSPADGYVGDVCLPQRQVRVQGEGVRGQALAYFVAGTPGPDSKERLMSLETMYAAYENVLSNFGIPDVVNVRRERVGGTLRLRFRVGSAEVDLTIFSQPGYLPNPDEGEDPFAIALASHLVETWPTAQLFEYVARANVDLALASLGVMDSSIESLVDVVLFSAYWDTGYPIVDLQRNFMAFIRKADELDDELLRRFGGFRYSEVVDGSPPRLYQPADTNLMSS
jgi:hypothetical protein